MVVQTSLEDEILHAGMDYEHIKWVAVVTRPNDDQGIESANQ